MKKTLIALAAAAATGAFAQSSVTAYGLADVGVNVTDNKGNTVTTAAQSNGSATSHLGFKGTEDLGGGMKAMFQFEATWSAADASSRTNGTPAVGTTSNVGNWLGNSQSFVGLSGGFGSVKLGTPNSATLSAHGIGNGGFSTAVGSGYRAVSFDAVRYQNSARYDSPSFNGFSVSYLLATANDKQTGGTANGTTNQTGGRDGVSEVGLAYANGPLNVQVAALTTSQDSLNGVTSSVTTRAGGKFNLTTLGAQYKPGAIGASVFYQRADSGDIKAAGNISSYKYDRTSMGVGLQFDATSALSFKAQYVTTKTGDAEAVSSGGAATVASQTTTLTALGVDYALSKRTSVYGRYEAINDPANLKAVSAGGYTASGNTYTSMAIGVRHSF